MFSRLKQLHRYIFCKFNDKNLKEIKEVLSIEEYNIFIKMQDYDKLHSYIVYKKVKEDFILKNNKIYLKLALLHDCGKGNVGILRRVKKVIFGDKKLEKHPELAYEKLKNIDVEVALLCRDHHKAIVDEKMKRFQKIDDE